MSNQSTPKASIGLAFVSCLLAIGLGPVLMLATVPYEGKFGDQGWGVIFVAGLVTVAGVVGCVLVYLSTRPDHANPAVHLIQLTVREVVDSEAYRNPPVIRPQPEVHTPTVEELKAETEARAKARKEAEARAYEERREREREEERRKAQAAKERAERDIEFDIQMRMARDLLTLEQIQKWRTEQRRKVHDAPISAEEKEERLEQIERTVEKEKERLRHDAEIFEEEE